MSAIEILVSGMLLLASALALVTAIGLQRFDSVFARIHPVTKAITLGVVIVCIAAAIRVDDAGNTAKLLLVAGFQIITAPIASHMVARAAYRSGTELNPNMTVDELAAEDSTNESS